MCDSVHCRPRVRRLNAMGLAELSLAEDTNSMAASDLQSDGKLASRFCSMCRL